MRARRAGAHVSDARRSSSIVLSGSGLGVWLCSTSASASAMPPPLSIHSVVAATTASASASFHSTPRHASQSRASVPPPPVASCSEARTVQKGCGTKVAIWSCRCTQNQSVGSWHGP